MNNQHHLTATDRKRLRTQLQAVTLCLWKTRDRLGRSAWLTLAAINEGTGAPQASVSARLRELRKCGHVVQRQRRRPGAGTFVYRVYFNKQSVERLLGKKGTK